jgi:hypothetical protein
MLLGAYRLPFCARASPCCLAVGVGGVSFREDISGALDLAKQELHLGSVGFLLLSQLHHVTTPAGLGAKWATPYKLELNLRHPA